MNNQRSNQTKIAYVLSAFPSLSETFILQEILELERQGLQLCLFSLEKPSAGVVVDAAQDLQASITYFRQSSLPILIGAAIRRFFKAPLRFLRTTLALLIHYRQRSVFRHILYAAYLANQLKHEGITHVHAHYATAPTSIAQSTYLLADIPYSFTAHAYDIYLSPKAVLAYKMQMARFVATCTQYNQQYLKGLVDQCLGEYIHCIYHGLNLPAFPSEIPNISTIQAPPLILTVSRLVEKKGLSYLLQACKTLKDEGYDFTCRIVGEGPLRQALEQEIRELKIGDRVELHGAETHERVVEMYQQATISTLPCIIDKNGDRDGIPNVLVEALAIGIPVVSTPVSGVPELITSEVNGLLVPPNDSEALASALARLLDDPSLRCRLAVAGRQTVVSNFDMRRNVKYLMNLFRTTPL